MKIGVLALQGDFREHLLALARLQVPTVEVRLPADLESVGGLIIPGGESTTIGRLAREFKLEQAVRERFLSNQLALWGTCAGAIWLAKDIQGRPHQERLGVMDIQVGRNAYGRQIDSFYEMISVPALNAESMQVAFIRAPQILKVGEGVEVLAQHKKQSILVRQGRAMASTFHPELGEDSRLHAYFVDQIAR